MTEQGPMFVTETSCNPDVELTTEDIELCIKVRERLQLQVTAIAQLEPIKGDEKYHLDSITLAAQAANALGKLIKLHT